MLLMKDRSILYVLRAYLICAKVGERSFLYELRSYFIYAKVGEYKYLSCVYGVDRKICHEGH